jgi:hypothetical protein
MEIIIYTTLKNMPVDKHKVVNNMYETKLRNCSDLIQPLSANAPVSILFTLKILAIVRSTLSLSTNCV